MLKITIHGTGTGTDSLTGKEGVDGLTVTFDDGTVREGFLSWKSFKQLTNMRLPQKTKVPTAQPVGNTVPAKN